MSEMAQDSSPDVFFRQITPQDVDATFELINTEEWIMTLEKLTQIVSTRPPHFYVAVTQEGQIVGTVSLTELFEGEYLVGNLIVSESMRGKGLGRSFLLDTFKKVDYKSIQLTAVPGVDNFYKKIGFRPCKQGLEVIHLKINPGVEKAQGCDGQVTVQPCRLSDVEELTKYDMDARGYDNSAFLRASFHSASVLLAFEEDHTKIKGYAIAYVKKGEIILDGLYADSNHVASILFRGVTETYPGETEVNFTTFLSNKYLLKFGELTASHSYPRYYLGQVPTCVNETKVYSVADCDYTR